MCACGESAQERLRDARRGLADADYGDALAAADAGLREGPDAKTSWGLELVKLEAQARSGQGDEALGQLERLASQHAERVPASQYLATADQLRSAGNGSAAIQVLDLGHRLHPGDSAIARLIQAAQSSDVDPQELEMLRSLGYVE